LFNFIGILKWLFLTYENGKNQSPKTFEMTEKEVVTTLAAQFWSYYFNTLSNSTLNLLVRVETITYP